MINPLKSALNPSAVMAFSKLGTSTRELSLVPFNNHHYTPYIAFVAPGQFIVTYTFVLVRKTSVPIILPDSVNPCVMFGINVQGVKCIRVPPNVPGD